MKYRYSRKEIADKWETTIKYSSNDLIRDLLATQPKPIKEEKNDECNFCGDKGCQMCFDNPKQQSKDIEYPILNEPLPEEITNWIKQVTDTLNSLNKRNIK